MAPVEIFTQSKTIKYNNFVFSWAFVIALSRISLVIVVTGVIAYRTNDLWISITSTNEQLKIEYANEYIVNFTTNTNNYFTHSTFLNYNALHQSHLRIPIIKVYEEDVNEDGIKDYLNFDLGIPMYSGEHVLSANVILVFNYSINLLSDKEFKGLIQILSWRSNYNIKNNNINNNINNININYSNIDNININKLHTTANLKLIQSQPLTTRTYFESYNSEITSSTNDVNLMSTNQSLFETFIKYTTQDAYLGLIDKTSTWTAHGGAESDFKSSILIGYPHQYDIMSYSSFWHSLKWAFIQYSSIFIFVYAISEVIMTYIFECQLVDTIQLQ